MESSKQISSATGSLSATGLVKRYAGRAVVDGVGLQLAPGRLIGLLGPNGAGKTTTVSMLCGLTRADAGEVRFGNEVLAGDGSAVKQRIGLVPQDLALYEDLTARHNLELFGALYGLSGAALRSRCDAVLEIVGLADRAKDKPATFSGGMKRRLNIACALVHDPDVVILDEPTVGVDPQSRNGIFDNLETLKAAGKALLYTTHYMEEVERLADEIIIMDHGKVVAQDTLSGLLSRIPARARMTLELDAGCDVEKLRATAGVLEVTQRTAEPAHAVLEILLADLNQALAAALAALAAQGRSVRRLQSERASLEDVFLALTGRQLRD